MIRSSEERKFLPKRASYPQILETLNSGVKVSDPDLRSTPISDLTYRERPDVR